MNWTKLGRDLRITAIDAHEGTLPTVGLAYQFLLANPECFIDQSILDEFNFGLGPDNLLTMEDVEIGSVDWPNDMPGEPNIELIAAYYGATA